jgi:hypothetical protein
MDKAIIEIECEGVDAKMTLRGDIYREEVFASSPIKASRARLVGEVLLEENRNLLDLSIDDLIRRRELL